MPVTKEYYLLGKNQSPVNAQKLVEPKITPDRITADNSKPLFLEDNVPHQLSDVKAIGELSPDSEHDRVISVVTGEDGEKKLFTYLVQTLEGIEPMEISEDTELLQEERNVLDGIQRMLTAPPWGPVYGTDCALYELFSKNNKKEILESLHDPQQFRDYTEDVLVPLGGIMKSVLLPNEREFTDTQLNFIRDLDYATSGGGDEKRDELFLVNATKRLGDALTGHSSIKISQEDYVILLGVFTNPSREGILEMVAGLSKDRIKLVKSIAEQAKEDTLTGPDDRWGVKFATYLDIACDRRLRQEG